VPAGTKPPYAMAEPWKAFKTLWAAAV
jgi:hypothetical protein